MSEVTGNIRTCPKASSIFICKYCDYDSDCGKQLLEMSDEEREAHYSKIFSEFEEWRIKAFPHSKVNETQDSLPSTDRSSIRSKKQ